MISPSEGHYDMLQLQPVGPSLHMTTYIQVNRRTTAHCQGTNNTRQQLVGAYCFSSSASGCPRSASVRGLMGVSGTGTPPPKMSGKVNS